MQNKTQIGIILCLLLVSLGGFSQSNLGSPYTRYGIGDIMGNSFGDGKAMGGANLALRTPQKLQISNPASYTSIDSLAFIMEVGVNAHAKLMESSSPSRQASIYDLGMDYLSFGFPINDWMGTSFGLMPYSNVGYDAKQTDVHHFYPAEKHFSGSGGINEAYFGLGISPFESLSLGANFCYLFGNIDQTNELIFTEDSLGLLDIHENKTYYFNDFFLSFGAQYSLQINTNNSLNIGLRYDNKTILNSRRTYIVTNSVSGMGSSAVDTLGTPEIKKDGEIDLPAKYGIGLAYYYKDKLTLAGDYSMQDWSESEIFGESDSLGTSHCFELGAEWIPDGRHGASLDYWKKVRYRAGVYFENSYLQFKDIDEQINDFGISFGLGLPVKHSASTINLSLEAGQRGSLKDYLVRERYVTLVVNFSLTDIWFLKRKID